MLQSRWLPWGLGYKLALVYAALLTIPLTAYVSIVEIESYLRESRQNALLATAKVTAAILQDKAELFKQNQAPIDKRRDLYAHHLEAPIELDGYNHHDWNRYWERARNYTAQQSLLQGNSNGASIEAKVLIGLYGTYLYMLIEVTDDQIVYRDLNHADPLGSDHIQLGIVSPKGVYRRYIITTEAPGWIGSRYRPATTDTDPEKYRREHGIGGEWQESDTGYSVELRIPINLVGDRFAFAVADVDDRIDRQVNTLIGSAHTDAQSDLGNIIVPAIEIEAKLKAVALKQTRLWAIDRNSRVLAMVGSLKQNTDLLAESEDQTGWFGMALQIFYGLLLPGPTEDFQIDLFGADRLEGTEILSALSGQASTRWRKNRLRQVSILSAAQPIWDQQRVIGAIVLEQTNNPILSFQHRALQHFFNLGFFTLLFAITVVVLFAARLTKRIRHLQTQVGQAINLDGQVCGHIDTSTARDELGELGRSFADMLERLRQYTRYLETMAAKLSHELRTPLTVVKSSLENMECADKDDSTTIYLTRAKEGVQRLSNIITGMSEATRLEQSLQRTEKQNFNIAAVIQNCVGGYRSAYPEQRFDVQCENPDIDFFGAPELIAQLLDKLISNAVEFTVKQHAIRVCIQKTPQHCQLTVSNIGPLLPEQMQGRLFDSMVSIRKNRSPTAHLGLGLYIVRLIAQYHDGEVSASNRQDQKGVVFTLRLPRLLRPNGEFS